MLNCKFNYLPIKNAGSVSAYDREYSSTQWSRNNYTNVACEGEFFSIESSERYTQTNCYSHITSQMLESGELAYKLNNSNSDGIWKQTIGEDLIPSFVGETVYRYYIACGEAQYYSNSTVGNTEKTDHVFVDGICSYTTGEEHYEQPAFENDYLQINNLGNFLWFAEATKTNETVTIDSVSYEPRKMNVKLNIDIDKNDIDKTQYEFLGLSSNTKYPYCGTFDGNYHTFTHNQNVEDVSYGIFVYIANAHIKNLYIKGVINGNSNYLSVSHISTLAGVYQKNSNPLIIENVHSDVEMNLNAGFYAGGFIGGHTVGTSSSIEIKNCGIILRSNAFYGHYVGGFVGADNYGDYYVSSITISNSYAKFYGALQNNSRVSAFDGKGIATLTNCYSCSDDNISQAGYTLTEEEFESGLLTYSLNNKQSNGFWKQTFPDDKYPVFEGGNVYPIHTNCGYIYDEFSNSKSSGTIPCKYDSEGVCTQVAGEIHYRPAYLNADGYYEISTFNEFLAFEQMIELGQTNIKAKLVNDLEIPLIYNWDGIGTELYPYSGEFDGQNHKISYILAVDNCSLFNYTSNATIKNLTLTGELTSTVMYTGALIHMVIGPTNLSYINSRVNVKAESYAAGLIGRSKANVVISNCIYHGTLTGITVVSGFIGINSATVDIINSLAYFTPNTVQAIYGFVYDNNANVTDSYFYTVRSNPEAILASGELAYILNKGNAGPFKQEIGVDVCPSFTGKDVYKYYVSCVDDVIYSNYLEDGSLTKLACSYDLDGLCNLDKDEEHYQPCEIDDNGNYIINNLGNYLYFVNLVNSNILIEGSETTDTLDDKYSNSLNAILNTDISISSKYQHIQMGSSEAPYCGCFDGRLNTITVDFSYTENNSALFKYVGSNAVIKNLFIEGNINSTANYTGVLISNSVGDITIDKVIINATINSSSDIVGGFISNVSAGNVEILNSAYIGTIINTSNSSTAMNSCFIGYLSNISLNINKATFTNCYIYTYENNCRQFKSAFVNFDSTKSNVEFNNCYNCSNGFSNNDGVTEVLEETVNSGELTYLLNNKASSSDNIWGQDLHTYIDKYPVFYNGLNIVYYIQVGGCSATTMGYSNFNENVYMHNDANNDQICDDCELENLVVKYISSDTVLYSNNLFDAVKIAKSGDIIQVCGDLSTTNVTISNGIVLEILEDCTLKVEEALINIGILKLYGSLEFAENATLSGTGEFRIYNYAMDESNVILENTYVYNGKDQYRDIVDNWKFVKTIQNVDFYIMGYSFYLRSIVDAGSHYMVIFNEDLNVRFTKEIIIERKEVVVTPYSKTITYNDPIPELTYYSRGFILLDDFGDEKPVVSLEEGSYVVGEYVLFVTGPEYYGNYKFTYKTSTLTVNPINISLFVETQHIAPSKKLNTSKFTINSGELCDGDYINVELDENKIIAKVYDKDGNDISYCYSINQNKAYVHFLEEEWQSYNSNKYHYQKCTYPNCTEIGNFGLHESDSTDVSCINEAICTICNSYYGEHAFTEWIIKTYPTDHSAGLMYRECELSHDHKEEHILPALYTNSYNVSVIKEATCEEAGSNLYAYSIYDEIIEFTAEVAPLGHKGGNANCNTLAVCTVCNKEYGDYKHIYGNNEIIEYPTATTTGLIRKTCVVDSYVKEEVLPVLGDAGYTLNVLKESNCISSGEILYSYKLGLETISFVVEVELTEDKHSFGEYLEYTTPTLTAPGRLYRVCQHDENHIEYYNLPVLNDVDYTIAYIKQNTCYEAGIATYSILVNNKYYSYTIDVPQLNHFDNCTVKLDDYNHWKECICGLISDKEAHEYGEWVIIKEATETSTGLREKTCECGHKKIERIPMLEVEKKISAGAVVAIVLSSTVAVGISAFSIVWFVIKKKKFSDLITLIKSIKK